LRASCVSSVQMAAREPHLSTAGEQLEFKHKTSGVLEVSEGCGVVFEELKIRRKHRYIIFNIGDEEIVVESTGARSEGLEDFKRALPFTDCRYAVYDHEYTTPDGRKTSKLWFLSWLPNNSTPYTKMAYTSSKGKLRDRLPGVFDIQAAAIEEMEVLMGLKKEDEEESSDFED